MASKPPAFLGAWAVAREGVAAVAKPVELAAWKGRREGPSPAGPASFENGLAPWRLCPSRGGWLPVP